jgi:hypothetical protein
MTAIRHDPVACRFETEVEGEHCQLDYTLADEVMTITHTRVPQAVGGRGIASELVRAALEEARACGWRVVPACSYAALWLRRHPDYQGLAA